MTHCQLSFSVTLGMSSSGLLRLSYHIVLRIKYGVRVYIKLVYPRDLIVLKHQTIHRIVKD